MDGQDTSPSARPAASSSLPRPPRSLGRSSSFSQRSNLPPPPPLSICPRPLLLPSWPPPSPSHHHPPSLVEDHLFLGSDLSARDLPTLRSLRISHVLSCVGGPHPFRPELRYRTLWLSDTPSQDISAVLFDVFDLLERVRLHPRRRRVLVHCSRGVSRSAALVVAYLMWRHGLPFDAALRRVRAARPATDPNLGFASQLISFQARLLGPPDTPRLYRIAPHSPYDPLHLVPKAVERCPSAADLDTRGAFLLRSPRGEVFVWTGACCDRAMARAAESAAAQIVRYERAAGPVVAVQEGGEVSEFWELLDGGESACGRVGEYDVDFEIFSRAARGGVVPEFGGEGEPVKVPVWQGGWGADDDGEEAAPQAGKEEVQVEKCVEPFGSPQSVFSRDLGTPSSVSDLSPRSSSSEWCNSSASLDSWNTSNSPGSELFYDGEITLGSARKQFTAVRMEVDVKKDEVEEEERAVCAKVEGCLCLEERGVSTEPALFRWPGFEKLDNLHPGVLDSQSIFLLLAPGLSVNGTRSRILYVWVGGKSQFAGSSSSPESFDEKLRQVSREFLDQMKCSVAIPVQVVKEDEEPEQFLNHLFSFHQSTEASPQ